MAFSAMKFIYDGEPCETYNLMIYSFNAGSGVQTHTLGAGATMIEDRTLRTIEPIVYGTKQQDPLRFQLTFGSENPIGRDDFSDIVHWLCGKPGYRVLEILQDDMAETRYKCYMTNLKHENIRDVAYAFTADVVCDCPYAYSYPETHTHRVSGSADATIYNDSAYSGYIYPTITLIPDNITQAITIVNHSDSNRIFKFSGLNNYDNEVLTIDNRRKIITSSNGANMYPYFNKNFFRLVRGVNKITVAGDCEIAFTFEKYKVAGS